MPFSIVILLKLLILFNINKLYLSIIFIFFGVMLLLKATANKFSNKRMAPQAVSTTVGFFLIIYGLMAVIINFINHNFDYNLFELFFSPTLYFSLFLMSSFLLIFKKQPFTLAYLKSKIDISNLKQEVYYQAMYELSFIWTLIFLFASIITLFGNGLIKEIISLVLIIFGGGIFGSLFSKWRIRFLNQIMG